MESTLSTVVPPPDPNEDLNNLFDSMKNAAVKSIGVLKGRAKANWPYHNHTLWPVRLITLENNHHLITNIGVHNEKGCLIATDAGKASVVAKYLEQQLTRDEAPLEPFTGPPRPLASPFTCDEINAAARSLNGIPNELQFKYSSNSVYERFADIINRSFEINSYLDPIGQANITPLQKPNKPIGPVKLKNLPPLTLPNAARKKIYPWQHY